MAKANEIVESGDTEITIEGNVHKGRYTVKGKKYPMITVSYEMRSKTTQVGGLPVDSIARALLSELVGEHHKKRF